MTVCSCLQSVTLSPHAGQWGRPECRLRPRVTKPLNIHASCLWLIHPSAGSGAGRPQCLPRANCDSCTSDHLLPAFPQCVTGLLCRLPTVLAPANCVDLRRPQLRVALLHSPFTRQLVLAPELRKCLPRAKCDCCAYLQPAFPKCVIGLHEPGTDLQCRPRAQANCDSYTYLCTMAHSLLAGPLGREPTESAKG